jgi:probable DNA metabolism protein
MTIFVYDKTFEGLLTVVFDAYSRKTFPDMLLSGTDPLPLFSSEVVTICTDTEKSGRVWKGLQCKLSKSALHALFVSWLSELPQIDMLLFSYIRKAIDAPKSIELNFGDPDVLKLSKVYKKVDWERLHVIQFLRFQKTADDTFFAGMEPLYNVLPLVTGHLKDRFHDQKWLLYDIKRDYGYYYDLKDVTEVYLEEKQWDDGKLRENLMAEDEKLFQQLWQTYFKSMTIKERINPKLHKQHLPVRFWKYLTEKQDYQQKKQP